jgi:hypothetical protein
MSKWLSEEFFEDNRRNIELRLLSRSIKPENKQAAVDALKPFVDEKMYAANKATEEYWAHQMFGQDKCGCGQMKSVREGRCWHCKANDY